MCFCAYMHELQITQKAHMPQFYPIIKHFLQYLSMISQNKFGGAKFTSIAKIYIYLNI